MSFAKGTTVPVEKTRMEIETTLTRYGAKGFAYALQEARARIEFLAHSRRVRFDLELPPLKDFKRHPKFQWQVLTDNQAAERRDAEHRRLWRALLLAIKAKLEVVSSGIGLFEEEFLAYIVLPGGGTVAQEVMPNIASAYEGKPIALLPERT